MSVIDIEVALRHQRIDDDADEQLRADAQIKLNAAELTAMRFMSRNVYANANDLAAARATVPALHVAASDAYDAAIADADAITNDAYKAVLTDAAEQIYSDAKAEISAIAMGMVINDQIVGAIMLIFGHLYENREDVVAGLSLAQLPKGAEYLLQTYRVWLGV
jgi:hypothetical protein